MYTFILQTVEQDRFKSCAFPVVACPWDEADSRWLEAIVIEQF